MCVLDFVFVPQSFKVLDSSCTLAWKSNDGENAFVFPQFPLIRLRFHERTIAMNEFLLVLVSHIARVRINLVRLSILLVVS